MRGGCSGRAFLSNSRPPGRTRICSSVAHRRLTWHLVQGNTQSELEDEAATSTTQRTSEPRYQRLCVLCVSLILSRPLSAFFYYVEGSIANMSIGDWFECGGRKLLFSHKLAGDGEIWKRSFDWWRSEVFLRNFSRRIALTALVVKKKKKKEKHTHYRNLH